MRRLHVLGRKNHGKTTLVAELVAELTRRGWRIGTIKHTHHHHELDTPGKDSHRHRLAGSQVVGILSPRMNAVFWEPAPVAEPSSPPHIPGAVEAETHRYADFERFMHACDLVVVEGDTMTDADKIEVWRAGLESRPIAAGQPSILAMVTDDDLPQELASRQTPAGDARDDEAGDAGPPLLRFPRADLGPLLGWIEERYLKPLSREDSRQ